MDRGQSQGEGGIAAGSSFEQGVLTEKNDHLYNKALHA
jgi:hypothetical protein